MQSVTSVRSSARALYSENPFERKSCPASGVAEGGDGGGRRRRRRRRRKRRSGVRWAAAAGLMMVMMMMVMMMVWVRQPRIQAAHSRSGVDKPRKHTHTHRERRRGSAEIRWVRRHHTHTRHCADTHTGKKQTHRQPGRMSGSSRGAELHGRSDFTTRLGAGLTVFQQSVRARIGVRVHLMVIDARARLRARPRSSLTIECSHSD